MANIRVTEAATYVGLSKSSLDKMRMHDGGPTFFKVGRAVVYAIADLDAWLETKRRTSTGAANDNERIARRSQARAA